MFNDPAIFYSLHILQLQIPARNIDIFKLQQFEIFCRMSIIKSRGWSFPIIESERTIASKSQNFRKFLEVFDTRSEVIDHEDSQFLWWFVENEGTVESVNQNCQQLLGVVVKFSDAFD